MTPQQRHITEAEKIVDAEFYADAFSWGVRCKLAEQFAAALADAENKAAWDVIKMAHATWAIPLDLIERIAKEVVAEYGPRPTDAAKEVGNE